MTNARGTRPIEILLAEDNPGDILLTREALAEAKIRNTLHVTNDGIETMAFLRNEEPYTDAPTPDLILLDLNMPRMDGREVLAQVKTDPEFRRIPIVVLTTSERVEDILKTYDLHANCYVTKPVDLAQFEKVVDSIEEFWFSIVRLPRA